MDFLFELLLITEDRSKFFSTNYQKGLEERIKNDGSLPKEITDPISVVKALYKADPTDGKYMDFITKMYAKGEFKYEDIKKINDEIKNFIKNLPRIKKLPDVKPDQINLNSYKSLNDLYDMVEQFAEQGEHVSNTAAEAVIKKTGVKKLIDTPNFKALIPLTCEAAAFYGSNTKWCTTSGEFDTYNNQGNLVIIIAKDKGKDRKFQLHYETDSFMNERDQPLSKVEITFLSSFPEYAKLLNMLIDKHYGEYIKN